MYPLLKETVAWIEALGAEVLKHELTFSEDVLKTAALPEYAWVKGVISTYLRTEVGPRVACKTLQTSDESHPLRLGSDHP